jgi:hypothetical protein
MAASDRRYRERARESSAAPVSAKQAVEGA